MLAPRKWHSCMMSWEDIVAGYIKTSFKEQSWSIAKVCTCRRRSTIVSLYSLQKYGFFRLQRSCACGQLWGCSFIQEKERESRVWQENHQCECAEFFFVFLIYRKCTTKMELTWVLMEGGIHPASRGVDQWTRGGRQTSNQTERCACFWLQRHFSHAQH